jgi:hypothetical protein
MEPWESPVRRRLHESLPVFGCTITTSSLDLAAPRDGRLSFPLASATHRHRLPGQRDSANAGGTERTRDCEKVPVVSAFRRTSVGPAKAAHYR